MSIVATLQAELATLERELATNPTYVKIQKIRDLLATYERPKPPASTLWDIAVTLPSNTNRYAMSRKARIKSAVAHLIQMHGGRVKRADILNYLAEQGILSGPRAVKVLAPILTEATEFKTDGKGYWSMADAPEEVAAE